MLLVENLKKHDFDSNCLKTFRLGMDVQSSEMMATDLQDLSTQASPDATNPDVLAAASTVSHEEAANAVSIERSGIRYPIVAFNVFLFTVGN